MDYVEQWYENLTRHTRPYPWKHTKEAWGKYERNLSRQVYGRVKIAIGPTENGSVVLVDRLEPEKLARCRGSGFYEQIVFGVIDVMMTHLTMPIVAYRLAILDVDIDEIRSVPIAYRMAARDAARRILSEQDKQS